MSWTHRRLARTCDDRRMDRRPALLVYYALAVLLGLLVGVTRQPGVPFFALLLVGGIGASFVRSQWLGARAWSRVDLSWGLILVAALLPAAYLSRTWPFA
jgi:hypothetical protein